MKHMHLYLKTQSTFLEGVAQGKNQCFQGFVSQIFRLLPSAKVAVGLEHFHNRFTKTALGRQDIFETPCSTVKLSHTTYHTILPK